MRPDKTRGGFVIDCGKVQGRRRVFRRKTKTEADAKASELRDERNRVGELALSLTPEQRVDAAAAYQLLDNAQCCVSLPAIVQGYIEGREKTVDSCTLECASAQRLKDMTRRELRQRSLDTSCARLGTFSGKVGHHFLVSRITKQDVLDFIEEFSPATQAAYLRELNALFNFCMKRGYCAANPCMGIDPPRVDRGVPECMSVTDVNCFMQSLYLHKDYYRYYCHAALGFFAGLRPQEIQRLSWDNVNLPEGIITITPEIAKTRRVRHVTVSDNLDRWLNTSYCGNLTQINFDHIRRKVCKELGIAWPHDCMRHTYASHHVAMHRDAALTAHEMGHTQGVDLLYKHYRGLVTQKDAKRFWAIVPDYKYKEGSA